MKTTHRKKLKTKDAAGVSGRTGGSASPALVVGIGAGAGGLKSLKKMLAGVKAGQGLAIVLIHHPSLTKKNPVTLLRNRTVLDVVEAADGMPVQADRIYIVPTEKFLNIAGDIFTLQAPVQCEGLRMPIDHFFCSLAADRRHRFCGIVLSGEGSDGTLGLSEIKAAGGRTFAENPGSAEFPEMPQNAVSTGVAEKVLSAGALAEAIESLVKESLTSARKTEWPEIDAGVRTVLDILRAKVGHDFRCYKPGTLVRRVRRRMTLGKFSTLETYAGHLAENPDEVVLLQKDLLIGVTDFFRQPQAWETLERKVVAPLVDKAAPASEIRVWVPGCATGKEVYSLAILLAEEMERINKKATIQIFATDADPDALATARTGSYPEDEIGENVSPERLKRFFTRKDGRYQVIKRIREQIVFAAQNITTDPPFSRMDLIICRNLLIYLDQQVQRKIITLFHFSLRDGGFLFLGNAETIGDQEDLFEPVAKKWRIYRRVGIGRSVNAEIPVYSDGESPALFKFPVATLSPRLSLATAAQQMLVDRFAPACVMINRKLQVLYVHGAIENYLTIPAGELSTSVVDMAREGLRARLRGAVNKCIDTHRVVSIAARVRRREKSFAVKAIISPLRYPRETDGLLLITFEDQRMAAAKASQPAGGRSDTHHLEEELKLTRDELQSTIEQLEGSNDQLKASNEEVMAANEELQSANEEMETSKEELQSLNEELNTINNRLQEKVDELEGINNDVVNLLSSAAIATVFLDKEFRIKRFTPAVTRLMSLISSDVGRPIADILLRFTDEALLGDARRVLAELTTIAKEVQADDGRWHIRRIMPYRTRDDRIEGVVITFVDVADIKETEKALNESRRRLSVILDSIADGFFALDREWRFTHINDAALSHFHKTREEIFGRRLFEVFPAARGTAFETEYRRAMESGEPVHFETASTVGDLTMEMHAYPGPESLTVLFRDVTERHRLAGALREARDRAEWLAKFPEENPNPVMRASATGIVLYCNPAAAKLHAWACKPGQATPESLAPLVKQAMTESREIEREVEMGSRIYDISVMPFPAESYANIYGRDITTSKEAEEALRKAKDELEDRVRERTAELRVKSLYARSLIEASLDPLMTISADGTITDVNHASEEATGVTRQQLIGSDFSDYFTEPESARNGYRKVLADGIVRDYPLTIRHASGRKTDVLYNATVYRNEEGKVTGVFAAARDITERKQMEEAVRAERQRFYDVLETLPVYAILLTPDYHVPFANRFFRERFGESNGKRCYEYLFNRTEPCEICETYTALKTGKPHHWEWLGPDGRNYDIHDFPFKDTDGSSLIMEVGIDITEMKRAEQALLEANETLEQRVAERTAALGESRRRLAEIVDSIADGFYALDREWRFTHINDEALRHMGLTREEILGRTLFDVFPEARGSVVETEYGHAMESGGPRHFENPSLITGRTLEIHAYPGPENLTVLFRDITEKNRLAEALRRNEATLRGVLDASKESIWLFSPDGFVLMGNETALSRFGKPAEEVIGRHFTEILTPELAGSRMARLKEAAESGQPVEFEDERAGISFFHSFYPVLNDEGRVTSIACFSRDITERKRAEEALQTTVQRLHALVENMHSGILFVGKGRIESANQAFCDLFGLQESPEELLGLTAQELLERVKSAYIRPDEEVARIWEIANLGQPVLGEEITMRNGRTYLRDFTPIYSDGKSYGLLWHHVDISDRKRAEEAVKEHAAQLETANRELESFSYSVSHDLRAPLRAIDGFSRMILKDKEESFDGETRRKFGVIRSNIQTMDRLINDLLDYSRLGRAEMHLSDIDMKELTEDVIKECRTAYTDREIELTVETLPPVYGDRSLIRHALANLIDNAFKFTGEREKAVIQVGGYVKGSNNVYFVRDNGTGFDMQYYDKLFGVFQRLHGADEFSGTGVGLANVQRIVQRHGGRVWAEGKVQEGAIFYFSLPRRGV